jgi:hypothetical protein
VRRSLLKGKIENTHQFNFYWYISLHSSCNPTCTEAWGQGGEARHTRGQGKAGRVMQAHKQVSEHGWHSLTGKAREAARTLLALQARQAGRGGKVEQVSRHAVRLAVQGWHLVSQSVQCR